MNIIVVSGYAAGIDTSAHLGAMNAHGKTIAVLGSGINVKAPEKHPLEEYILENGVFVSEQNNIDEPRKYEFLMARDRITAGLSDAIFVIETDCNGGAVHTAIIGKGQGKKVYAIDWKNLPDYSSNVRNGNAQIISDGIAAAISILDAGKEFETEITHVLKGIF